jgi:flagellar biosynthetic protein FlhB
MAEDSAQEKSEAPTAKKRSDARKKGNVAKSPEINSVFVLFAAVLMLRIVGPYMLESIKECLRVFFALTSTTEICMERLAEFSYMSIMVVIKVMLPLLGAVLVAGLLANIIQIGLLLTLEPMKPKLEKINPLSGIKRLFELSKIVDTVKNLLKIGLVGYIAYITIRSEYEILVGLADATVAAIWSFITLSAFDILVRCAVVLLVLAVADYGYQRYRHEKKLKMSHQEIKEEFKQMEGDPKVKGRIRQLQREMSQRRMMDSVPQASVVVTNPTHFAVALLFDKETMEVPIVVAKGKDHVALKIKQLAIDNGVPTYEDRPLARSLYDTVEIGQEIPPELWKAVIEVFVWVERLKNKAA